MPDFRSCKYICCIMNKECCGCCGFGHQIADVGHTHMVPGMMLEDTGFDINEHLAALPENVREDYKLAVKRGG